MTLINLNDVAAAKQHFEENGLKATVRAISKHLKADTNRVTEFLGILRKAQQVMIETKVQVNPAICELIVLQIEETKAQAIQQAELRAKAAEGALNELAILVKEIDAMLVARSEELGAAQALLLQREGQLQERVREIEELRISFAAAIDDADARVSQERTKADSLREDLASSNALVGTMPRLEADLKEAQQLVKIGQEAIALARQSEAVAIERAQQHAERARDAFERECRTEAQRQRLQDEQKKARDAELLAQQKVGRLSAMVSSLDARCAEQVVEIAKLREAQNDANNSATESAPPLHDQRRVG